MLLQEIVREFDAELTRLASLRVIVADLASSRVQGLEGEIDYILLHPPMPEAAGPAKDKNEVPTDVVPAKRSYTRRTPAGAVTRRMPRRRPVEAGAIASSIPSGPVVVSVAALQRERGSRQTPAEETAAKPEVPALNAESSNDLARTLAQRWLSGDSASF